MADPLVVTGDDVELAITLKKDKATFDMTGATVNAMIIKGDHSEALTGAVVQNEAAAGASWSASLLVLEIPAAETSGITYYGKALIAIQVDNGKKQTWYVDCTIAKGLIA